MALFVLLLLLLLVGVESGAALDNTAFDLIGERDATGLDVNRTVRIQAYKDATLVQQSYAGCNGSCADTNFGLSPVLQLGSYHLDAEVVMAFILTPPIPTQARILSCKLVLPTKAITVVGNSHVLVTRIAPGISTWSEEEVTWSTRPDLDRQSLGWVNMLDANQTTGDNEGKDNSTVLGTLVIDPEVCAQNLDMDGEIGFNLRPELGAFISFSSREDTSRSAQHAVLEISFWCCPDLNQQARSQVDSSASAVAPDGVVLVGFLVVAALVTSFLSLPFHFPL